MQHVPLNPDESAADQNRVWNIGGRRSGSLIPDADVFAAFQTISHRILRHPGAPHDVLVAGAPRRKTEVMELIASMDLHPIDAGPIEVAGHLERMTALLISINKANKVKESGIKITGI